MTLETSLGTDKPYTEVKVDAFGRITIEGKNFTGDACSLMGGVLAKAAGGGTAEPKPEMYHTENSQTNTQNW